MKCREIIDILEELAPSRMACDWDNPGLLAGRREKEVKKILLTLDVDDFAVKTAVSGGADMIISHHPLIFKGIKQVNDEDFIGRRLLDMIRADIACFAMHTNFDAAPGCMADLAAERLGIEDGVPLEVMGAGDGAAYGIGKCGLLSKPETGKALANRVKEAFGLPFVTMYGDFLWEKEPVKKIAVCPGSGRGMTELAVKLGAQAIVTGDIGHHEGIDANAQGLMVIDAGHYGLEHIFMDFMEAYLNECLNGGVVIEKMPVRFPASVY